MMSRPPVPDPVLESLLRSERDAPGPDVATQDRLWERLQTNFARIEGEALAEATARPAAQATTLVANLSAWIIGPIALGVALVGTIAHAPAPTGPAASTTVARANEASAFAAPTHAADAPIAASADAPQPLAAMRAAPTRPTAAESVAPPVAHPQPAPPPARAQALRSSAAEAGHAARPTPRRRRPATRSRSAAAAEPAASETGGLREELQLVRAARAALGNNQADNALATLRAHADRFPAGQLREERDALRVVALVRHGDGALAQSAARAFLRRYPHSMQTGIVTAAVRGLR